ncbi:MAG TPA: divalent metal cation transporter [Cytophagales bacterium]|nr:divalent metal cation transporter [Cytophagales bacterium]HAA20812.1 divalent metal cation transporter [Cytophagales bacterium]HAP59101.1 divalent metal cation transporter [Cytophagales bacterium]
MTQKSSFWKSLGPGILFAGTAVGVSHLVQSTRAGAEYGFLMFGIILLANLLKYPFFEFGSRYTAYTGKHLLYGYRQLSRGFLALYLVLSLGTLFTVSAAVTLVTAGLISQIMPSISIWWISFGLYTLFWLLLSLGKYQSLDRGVKIMGIILLVTTLAAFAAAAIQGPSFTEAQTPTWSTLQEPSTLFFTIALIGWMPTAVDISSWHSLWTVERNKSQNTQTDHKATMTDFRIGYGISALTALCFLGLGRWLLFGNPTELPASAGAFANVIIGLFTESLGNWARPVILVAAITTMLSTCVTVIDGYSRVMQEGLKELKVSWAEPNTFYRIFAAIMALGGLLIIRYFTGQLKSLVDMAMVISFLISPVVAGINFYLVTHKSFPKAGRPKNSLKTLAWLGMAFMLAFAIAFIWLFF